MEPPSKGFPGIWEFTLIVVVVLFAVTCATSVAMHCHLYRLRRRQRSRDLAAHASRPYGLKILSLTHEMLDKLPVRIYTTADRTGEERQEKNLNEGTDNIVNKKDDGNKNDENGEEKDLQQDGEKDLQQDGQKDGQETEEGMGNKEKEEVGEHLDDKKEQTFDKVESEQITNSDKENQTFSPITPASSPLAAESLSRPPSRPSSKSERSLSRRISVRSIRSTRSTKSERSLRAVASASALASGHGVSGSGVSEDTQGYQETCAICLEDFGDGDELRQLPCGHEYHKECVDPWLLEKSSQCPLCKRDCFPDPSPMSSNASLPQSTFSSRNNVYVAAMLSWSPIASVVRSCRKVRNVIRRRHGVRWTANEGENNEGLPEPVTAVPSSEATLESRGSSADYRNVRAEA